MYNHCWDKTFNIEKGRFTTSRLFSCLNLDLTSQGYLGYVKQIRDIDYNDLRPTNYTDGFYAIASNRNCPFNEGWTYVILLSFSNTTCAQIAIDSNALVSKIKTRTLVADNWGAWQDYATKSDLENVSNIKSISGFTSYLDFLKSNRDKSGIYICGTNGTMTDRPSEDNSWMSYILPISSNTTGISCILYYSANGFYLAKANRIENTITWTKIA